MADVSLVIGMVDEEEAEATLNALLAHGIPDDEIEVHTPTPGRYRLADELLHEEAKGAWHGALLGAVVGGLVGLAASAIVIDRTAAIVMVGVLGVFLGILVGGMAGLLTHDRQDDDPVEFHEVGAQPTERVIEIHSEHWRGKARKVLEQHGADLLATSEPVAG